MRIEELLEKYDYIVNVFEEYEEFLNQIDANNNIINIAKLIARNEPGPDKLIGNWHYLRVSNVTPEGITVIFVDPYDGEQRHFLINREFLGMPVEDIKKYFDKKNIEIKKAQEDAKRKAEEETKKIKEELEYQTYLSLKEKFEK